jgi:hypothetical protein
MAKKDIARDLRINRDVGFNLFAGKLVYIYVRICI